MALITRMAERPNLRPVHRKSAAADPSAGTVSTRRILGICRAGGPPEDL